MTLPLAIAAIYGSSLATLVWIAWRAPEGHEVPGVGFIYGPDPRDDTSSDAAKALSHCTLCNSWITGPCGWSGCELTALPRSCAVSSCPGREIGSSRAGVSVVDPVHGNADYANV